MLEQTPSDIYERSMHAERLSLDVDVADPIAGLRGMAALQMLSQGASDEEVKGVCRKKDYQK